MTLIQDKVIYVTGATRGIGRAIAVLLAKHGAQVVIHGRSEESLMETEQAILALHALTPFKVIYDVCNDAAMKLAFMQVKKQFGCLDGLVNNAGIMDEALLGMLKTDSMQHMLNVNTIAVINHMQFASRLLMKSDSSSIVNMSSIIGVKGASGGAAYAASKAAVVGATLSAAKEWASIGIRVNAIAPGFIETDLTSHYEGTRKDKVLSNINMNRFGQAEEVANVALFLLSDMSSYVTGQVIGVDGGMVI